MALTRHSPRMRTLCLLAILPFCVHADEAADRTAVRKAIHTFNDVYARQSVLAPNADIPDFSRCWRQELSQILFETKAVRFVTPDVALADADANRYQLGKQTAQAFFILKREGADWKIDSLRMMNNCVTIVPLGR
jgi:hypothetical protein